MSDNVKIHWLVENHILLIDMYEAQTPHMAAYDTRIVDFLDASSHVVDLIIRVPPPREALPPLKRLTSYEYQRHAQLGYVIMVGVEMNPIIRFLLATISKMRKMNMRIFSTVDEGLNFLKQVRSL